MRGAAKVDNKTFGLREGVLEKIIEFGINYGAARLVLFIFCTCIYSIICPLRHIMLL